MSQKGLLWCKATLFKAESGHRNPSSEKLHRCLPRVEHVIPAGMFGWRFVNNSRPHNNAKNLLLGYENGDPELAILVEYAEELHGDDERENADRDRIKNNLYINMLLHTYNARVIPTGICMDLLNLRPEICAVIVIIDPTWSDIQPRLPLNWGTFDHEQPNRRHDTVSLAHNNELADFLDPKHTLPSGAGAFWAASDVAQREWNEMKGL